MSISIPISILIIPPTYSFLFLFPFPRLCKSCCAYDSIPLNTPHPLMHTRNLTLSVYPCNASPRPPSAPACRGLVHRSAETNHAATVSPLETNRHLKTRPLFFCFFFIYRRTIILFLSFSLYIYFSLNFSTVGPHVWPLNTLVQRARA